jgi:mannose-6-phosphate isomerase-like protein (cupin superfamily)
MVQGTIVSSYTVEPINGYCGLVYELIGTHNSCAEHLDCVIVEIPPGARSRGHRHSTGEELYFVLSGRAVIYLGTDVRTISEGYVVHIPPGVYHMVENSDSLPLRLFVVNAPPYNADDVIFEGEEP